MEPLPLACSPRARQYSLIVRRFFGVIVVRFAQTAAPLRLLLLSGVVISLAPVVCATELTGISIFVCESGGDTDHCDIETAPLTPAWHTGLDDIAGPIAVTESLPPRSYLLPLINGPLGTTVYPLTPGDKHVLTLLWQSSELNFPSRFALNFFFNGDQLLPGISAIVPTWAGLGFTNFHTNFSATTYSMYFREVESPATLQYTDGNNQVTVTALMAAHSSWFAPADRVGLRAFGPDGNLDAVAIVELSVTAVEPTPALEPRPSQVATPRLAAPLHAVVGPDESPPHDDEAEGTPSGPTDTLAPSTFANATPEATRDEHMRPTPSAASPAPSTPTPKRKVTRTPSPNRTRDGELTVTPSPHLRPSHRSPAP